MTTLLCIFGLFAVGAKAADLSAGEPAPLFELKNQAGIEFKLADRKGHWTVLYFYPKADTPGCTKQACTFRDHLSEVRALGAEVFGISVDSVEDQQKFHKKHHLNFDLLADGEGKITQLYGAKMPVLNMSKRWTFIVDPDLKIRHIDKGVDPVKDSARVTAKLKELQGK